MKVIRRKCECGCGRLASPGKRFLPGHAFGNKMISEERKKEIVEKRKTFYKHPNIGGKLLLC